MRYNKKRVYYRVFEDETIDPQTMQLRKVLVSSRLHVNTTNGGSVAHCYVGSEIELGYVKN